ncbi:hypothetical protein [Pseudemcibacter aquimaris]|uniref:hypothetical protein n=1 Tax=Pseudemcibacter aquimaris TaxID=2857064 RepID=UPI00201334FB|nr:hypothetical protein [Pseudemcibacter aquimaris]MCC3859880.1 hypothetical protein [Pseudemcibacter aquimaris]WDU57212.1 hypothetical protein KW060_08375 [Pseudemcibacter aquimaris]
MALQSKRARKPVIFGRKKKAVSKPGPDDDTLDMLYHYAQAGMEYAQRSMEETPHIFTQEEKEAFQHNKNMLEQAPFLIENYKSKVAEYDALHKKMLGILHKCEEIVAAGDTKSKDQIKGVLKEAKVFTYNADGDLVLKKGAE